MSDRSAKLFEVVQQRLKSENAHDVDSILKTFSDDGCFYDKPAEAKFYGKESIATCYQELFEGVPDVKIEAKKIHVAADSVIVEVDLAGTHKGGWPKGLPGTDKQFVLPVCAVFCFDEQDRISLATIYYDSISLLKQIGMM